MSEEAKSDNIGIEKAVYLCYGTAGVVKNQRELARKILDQLRREVNLERKELMRRCGLDPTDPSGEGDNQFFNNTVNKLLGDNRFDMQLVAKFREGNEMYYHLDISSFNSDLSSLKKSVKDALVRSPVAVNSDHPYIYEDEEDE